jgi:glucuronoarabinoxylan endo-1,4-beta-xylanase
MWSRNLAAAAIFLVLLPRHAESQAVVYLDSLRQVISGFGAANILPWRPDMTAEEIQKAFGTGSGQLGFTILRLRVPPTTADFALNLPTAQAAHNMGATIIASPWSPPAGMKTNNNTVGGALLDTSYASYASHLKSFVDYMAANGVPLYAVSVQNEPDVTVTYESCDWNTTQMVKFVKEQGNAVGTKLMAPESFNFNPTMANAILNDSAATANVDIIAGHIYGGGLTAYPLAAAKGKEHWMTEHLVLDTTWTAVFGTGKEIHDCMNAGMNAYIWWYIVRFYGPIHDGEGAGGVKGAVTKRGYVMSQFSRFIRPGYVRILAWIPRGNVYITAYKGGSKVVVVAINTDTSAVQQTVAIENLAIPAGGGGLTDFTPYVTSATKDCEEATPVAVSNNSFTATLDGSSVTTFVGDVVVGVKEDPPLPQTIQLFQNYPNPFNPTTEIRYRIPEAGHVSLKVYNMLGQVVATLFEGKQDPGSHVVTFDGSGISAGVYVYKLSVNDNATTKKLVLVK